MNSNLVQALTRNLPFPGSLIRQWLNALDPLLDPPQLPTVTIAKLNGIKLEIRSLREYIQRNIFFLGYYELRESLLLRRLLRDGDTFVDVGANIGWFTLLASVKVGPSGRVFAFEPAGAIFEHLKRNIALNACANVRAENLALSDEGGVALLTGATIENAGLGSLRVDASAAMSTASDAEEVQMRRFDNYWYAVGGEHIRLMKIDVEGAELRVLRGMQDLLAKKTFDFLLIEVSQANLTSHGGTSHELLHYLQDRGYRLFTIGLRGLTPLSADTPVQFANVLAEAVR